MHTSSYEKIAAFVTTYLDDFRGEPLTILDVGSQMVADQLLTYRTLFDAPTWTYTGLDVEAGINVDIVPADHYRWDEVEPESFDLIVSGQTFEHIPYFWATAFEIARALRPGGLAVITAPGRGPQHRYPVDCWRFHDDGFEAVANYLEFEMLDVFTDWGRNIWEESIVVIRKPVWSPTERFRFATRLWHQRAITASAATTIGDAPTPEPDGAVPAPSALRSVVGGRYTPVLAELREHGIRARAIRDEAAKPFHRRIIPQKVRRRLTHIILRPKPFSWDDDMR